SEFERPGRAEMFDLDSNIGKSTFAADFSFSRKLGKQDRAFEIYPGLRAVAIIHRLSGMRNHLYAGRLIGYGLVGGRILIFLGEERCGKPEEESRGAHQIRPHGNTSQKRFCSFG